MDYLRQLDILNPANISFPLTVIGCGGIGSPTVLELAKMGFPKITLFDYDLVEEHNRPNQLYRKQDLEKSKVTALKDIVAEFAEECLITTINEKFDGDEPLSGIVISGVDRMATRQLIWDNVKYNVDVPFYIDGRIGGEVFQVYSSEPCQIKDIEFYEKFLFPDEEVAELPCTERGIMYTGFGIAWLIGVELKKWLTNKPYDRRISIDPRNMSLIVQ